MPDIRSRLLIVATCSSAACLETHAPPERAPLVAPKYDDVVIDPSGGSGPVVLFEGGTGIHVLYLADPLPDYSPVPLGYAGCAGGCESAANWRVGVFDYAAGPLASGAVLAGGAIHAAYETYDPPGSPIRVLRYALCRAGCGAAANWQKADLDTTVLGGGTHAMALTADPAGVLHLTYVRQASGGLALRYASCANLCTDPANWVTRTLDSGFVDVPAIAIGVDGGGQSHLTFLTYQTATAIWSLRYGTCPANCSGTGAWSFAALDSGHLSAPSLVTGSNGVGLVYSIDSTVHYGSCRDLCADRGSWRFTALPAFRLTPNLARGPADDLFLVSRANSADSRESLQYAECDSACGDPAAWSLFPILTDVFSYGIGVDLQDHLRIAYSSSRGLRLALFR